MKALARATGLSRIRKFKSLDGTIDYFDYSDDTNEEDGEDEDGTNTNEDSDEDDDTDGSEEDEEEDDETEEIA